MKSKLLTFSFLLLYYFGNASIVNVPSDFNSIQAAINSSAENDTILVDNGNYAENIIINKPILLTSKYLFSGDTLDIEQTIIDGSANGSVISIIGVNNVMVKGFTVKGGNGSLADPYEMGEDFLFGGGFFIDNANNIYLSDNVVKDNVLTTEHNSAGGIYADSSNISIVNCNIKNNMVNGGSFHGEGAGVFLFHTIATIDGCKIEGNISDVNYGRGGGIYARYCSLQVSNSKINNNTSIESGGIYCFDTDVVLNNVEVNENIAQLTSALYVYNMDTTDCIIHNSTFLNNQVGNSGGTIALNRVYADFDNIVVNDNFGGVNSGGINCTYSEFTLKNSELKRNSSDSGIGGDAAGILLYKCNADIQNVVIDSNFSITSTHFNTGAFTATFSTVVMDSVFLTRNSADLGAAINTNSSDITIKNSLIANNTALDDGGAIYSYGSDFKIINTTIADNVADLGIIFSLRNNFLFLNSILWNEDEPEIYYAHSNGGDSHSDFAFTNIRGMQDNIIESGNGDVSWLGGNLDVNPLFVNADNLDYSLIENSLMIDAGTDFFEMDGDVIIDYNTDDYFGMNPDMGAFEFDPLTIIEDNNNIDDEINVYPNPFSNNVRFSVPDRAEFVKVEVYNLSGQLLHTETYINAGQEKNIELRSLKPGSYLMHISSDNYISKRFLIKY